MFTLSTRSRLLQVPAAWAVLLLTASGVMGRTRANQRPVPGLHARAPALLGITEKGRPAGLPGGKKLVVLEFGRMDDPMFRRHVAAMEALARRFQKSAVFLVMLPRPTQRRNAAGEKHATPLPPAAAAAWLLRTRRLLHLHKIALVCDAPNQQSLRAYGGLPNGTFILLHKRVAARYPWVDPPRLAGALAALAAGRSVPGRFQGPPQLLKPFHTALVAGDFYGVNPRTIGGTLDDLHLRPRVMARILPHLTRFMTRLRPTMQAFRAWRRDRRASTRRRLRRSVAALRRTAAALEHTLRRELDDKQYRTMIGVLARGPLRRVFLHGD